MSRRLVRLTPNSNFSSIELSLRSRARPAAEEIVKAGFFAGDRMVLTSGSGPSIRYRPQSELTRPEDSLRFFTYFQLEGGEI